MSFDVAVSLLNFNKLTKKEIVLPSVAFPTLIRTLLPVERNIFMHRNYCKKRPPQTSKDIAIINYCKKIFVWLFIPPVNFVT